MDYIKNVSPDELAQLRAALPGYKFRVYDAIFTRPYERDAEMLLMYGRELLYTSAEISEDRLLLAKAEAGGLTAALYVDRDYFEISIRDEEGYHHAASWQWPVELRGHSVDDLEYMLAQYLLAKNKSGVRP